MWMYDKGHKRAHKIVSGDLEAVILLRRVSIGFIIVSVLLWLGDYLTKGVIFFYLPFNFLVVCNIIALSIFVYSNQKIIYPKIIAWKYYPKFFQLLSYLLLLCLVSLASLRILPFFEPTTWFINQHLYWIKILELFLFTCNLLLSYLLLALKFIESEGRLSNRSYAANFSLRGEDNQKKSKLTQTRLFNSIIKLTTGSKFDHLIIGILFLAFLAYRIYVIARFPFNFPDEFSHAFVGLELFKNGHFPVLYNDGEPYLRGAYASVAAGFFLTVLGKHLWVIKLTPLLIGIADYWLTLGIAKRVISKKILIYFVLALFTINPLIALNHFYLRMYIFYELFLLLVVYLIIKIIESAMVGRYRKSILHLIFLLAVNYLNYYWSFDEGRYMILLASSVGLILGIFFIQRLRLNPKNILSRIFRGFAESGITYKVLIISIAVLYLFFRFDFISKIDFISSAELTGYFYHQSYLEYFSVKMYLLSLLFVISAAIVFLVRDNIRKIILFEAIILASVHLFSGPNFQIIRGLLYFLPLFLIVAFIALDYIWNVTQLNTGPIVRTITLGLFIFAIFFFSIKIYPKDFSVRGFSIEADLGPNNYEEVYKYLADQYSSRKIVQVGYNTPAFDFFDRRLSYEVDLRGSLRSHYAFCQKDDAYFECHFNTPLISRQQDFESLLLSDQYCIISSDWRNTNWLDQKSLRAMNTKTNVHRFTDYTLYCR